jgi:hypothetical protein
MPSNVPESSALKSVLSNEFFNIDFQVNIEAGAEC